jgi:hypothetical protein
MTRISALVMVMALPLFAAEKEAAKHVGTWSREVSGHKIAIEIKGDSTLKIVVNTGDKKVDVAATYGVTKEGVVFAIMTKVEKDITEGPEKGDLFAFTFTITDKEMTVSDFKGTKVNDGARKILEGVYTKK